MIRENSKKPKALRKRVPKQETGAESSIVAWRHLSWMGSKKRRSGSQMSYSTEQSGGDVSR